MAPVALAFAVLDLGGSPAELAVILTAGVLPQLALLIIGGVIADRLPRGAILVTANVLAGAAQAAVALLVARELASWQQIAVLAAVAGCATSFLQPAMRGAVQQLVPAEQLQRANALLRLPVNVMLIAGPLIGGGLVAFIGPSAALAVDAVSFVLAALLQVKLRLPRLAVTSRGVLADLRDGFTAVHTRSWVWSYIASGTVVVALWLAGYALLGPIAADRYYGGATSWGAVQASLGAGLVCGAAIALRHHPSRPMLAATLGSSTIALPLLSMGSHTPLTVVMAAAVIAGIGLSIAGVSWETAIGRHLPADLIGRVTSWSTLGQLSAAPLSYLTVGAVSDHLGITNVLLGAGILILITQLSLIAIASIRNLPREPVHSLAAVHTPAATGAR